jgi:hypothetical protein
MNECNLLYNCFWASPEQSLLGRSPAELTTMASQSQRYITASVLVSGTHLGPATNFSPSLFSYFWTVAGLLMWGAFSDEKSSLWQWVKSKSRYNLRSVSMS